jgi:fucose permease
MERESILIVLLIIIYISFIGLGLPDSLLGAAWPSMYKGLGVSIANAGIVSMIIVGGTIISSLFRGRVVKIFGAGPTTLISVAMTASALLGFSVSNSFAFICLCAVPLGLGGGSVDAVLNNFVALHFKAKHMNWLHCFWGLGASAGPIIMSYSLVQWGAWNAGYRSVGFILFALVFVLLVGLPLWEKSNRAGGGKEKTVRKPLGIVSLTGLPGLKPKLAAFFCYCALESTAGLWGSSYLVVVRDIPIETAARWISLFYFGITLGRAFSGFLAMKLAHRQMVRIGGLLIGAGILILLSPLSGPPLLVGLSLAGLGCAPIFPSLLHETPDYFGSEHSQSIMGIQMASAYAGTMAMPPLFGLMAISVGYGLFPIYLGALLILMAVMLNMSYGRAKICTM